MSPYCSHAASSKISITASLFTRILCLPILPLDSVRNEPIFSINGEKPYFFGSGVMRMRKSSTTAKCPVQSVRLARAATAACAACRDDGAEMRKRIIPLSAGSLRRNANSPKSLSNVTTMRFSRCARSRTSTSLIPGESVRIQATSWPCWRKAVTASPGKFSFANKRIVHAANNSNGYTRSARRISLA